MKRNSRYFYHVNEPCQNCRGQVAANWQTVITVNYSYDINTGKIVNYETPVFNYEMEFKPISQLRMENINTNVTPFDTYLKIGASYRVKEYGTDIESYLFETYDYGKFYDSFISWK